MFSRFDKNKWLFINLFLIAGLAALFLYHRPYLSHRFQLQQGCQVSFIDVGKGDCSLIQLKSGTTILIDGGEYITPGTEYDVFQRKLLPVLRERRLDSFDIVVATHPHSDHIGGLCEVLKTFPVKTVVDHGYLHSSFLYERFLKTTRKKKIYLLRPSGGEELRLSEKAKILFLSPPKDKDMGSLNDNSLVLKFIYGEKSFLYMADAGVPTEKWLLKNMKEHLQSDVLKIGHHGSITSTHHAFVEAVSPSISVISVGPAPYRIPREEVLKTLDESGTKTFRTDVHGTITISTEGKEISVETEK